MTDRRKTLLDSRLRAVWRREQGLRLAEGALALIRWGLVLFFAGFLVDWGASKAMLGTPAPVRLAMLLVIVGVALHKAWRAGWRRIRPFDATRTALQIEAWRGGMASLLVSAVQLRHAAPRAGTSRAMAEVTRQEAEQAAGSIRAADAGRFRSLRRLVLPALAVVAVLAVLAVTQGPLLRAGLGRIFAPWLVIQYPTRTHLELAQGDCVVQEGQPVRIAARVRDVVPREARIELRTGAGRPRVRTLPIVDGECAYPIETAFRTFDYRLTAGDARSAWHTVEVIPAPNIEQATVSLEFPAYTERPPETVDALTLTVPETTRIQWTLALDRPVREAALRLAGQAPVPLAVSADGRTVSVQAVASDSRAYAFSWVEQKHGFAFTSPNYYLQVSPDRPPRVELTVPARNLYATLGRKLDLAFRGRDDHGIGESLVVYHVDKTEEVLVPFTPAGPVDGREQRVDWDYRSALTNLVVGQSVTFAVELADRYPGEKGPHRVRSEARRVQFLSTEDYLAQVERQKRRLLSQLRAIYREEREVHAVVLRLDPSDRVFVQNCQLEAVRQDLTCEKVEGLAGRMFELSEDLAANSITNQTMTASLVHLRTALQSIADEQITPAAGALRALAGEAGEPADHGAVGKAHAVHMVDRSARELGLLVLDLGYPDAADVMARELHAAAQTQAALRLRTTVATGEAADLAVAQERLGKWLARLFAASPGDKESTVGDALVAFTLTRMVKQLIRDGVDTQPQQAATLIRQGRSAAAARLQAEVIASLLKAEFRLRVGAEREALATALELFESQAEAQRKLRLKMNALDNEMFGKRRAEMAEAEARLHRNLQLLLMPEIPAPRTHLFDAVVPSPPPVADWLAAADAAMVEATSHIRAGERDAAERKQSKAEESLAALAGAVNTRIAAMTQAVRIQRLVYGSGEIAKRLERFHDRQLGILERTEDAAADGSASAYLADQQKGLADAVEELRVERVEEVRNAAVPSEYSRAFPVRLEDAGRVMRHAIPLLSNSKPKEAARSEDTAVSALTDADALLTEHDAGMGAYASILADTAGAAAPRPFVAEIEAEQHDMLAITRKTKPEDLPKLALAQKNLIHAVDAVLGALDPIAHLVSSGTVMLFAKEDMDSAATALEERDPAEATDAQSYVAETLRELGAKIDVVIPQYRYLLEMVEALQKTAQEGIVLREAERRLRQQAVSGADAAGLAREQGALKERAAAYAGRIEEIAGFGQVAAALEDMAAAGKQLDGGNVAAAAEAMAQAEDALKADTAEILTLMTNLTLVLAAPEPGKQIPSELQLLRDVLVMAAAQQNVYRESGAAKPAELPGFEPKLRAFAKACDPFIERARQHKNPLVVEDGQKGRAAQETEAASAKPSSPANLQRNLVAAKGELADAASSAKARDGDQALARQKKAAESLRHFVAEYALKFVIPPGPPSSDDSAPTTDFSESEDLMKLFMPGVVTGVRPKDGRLEWDVLGKRERAALNENFARELPLEYRAILKDYYERLAR